MVLIGNDHAGYEVKKELVKFLKENHFDVTDYGCDSSDSVDYPDYAFRVCENIGDGDKGILICTTGIGMSIAANKVKGIRCAKVDTVDEARLTRLHNDSNVLAISALKDLAEIKKIVLTFLDTPFYNEERHIRRIGKINEH